MSRGKNETRKRVLYAHGVVFFTKALGPSSSSFFFAVRETFYSLLSREKKNALVGFCVCVSTFIMRRDLFPQKLSVGVGVLFFFFSFFWTFFRPVQFKSNKKNPLLEQNP